MQDFQGQGSDRLDSFFDHVEELADFYRWDGRETFRQARAHLRGTVLAYVKRVPFQPRTWEELKALLLKRFQPRDLTATYKAQFRARRRRHGEDIHTFVEALQRLARPPETVDGDAVLPLKVAPAVERNPRSAISAKGSGISLGLAPLTGTTG